MPTFNFKASAECDRCGKWLSKSTDDCALCEGEKLRRYHFIHISDEDRIQLVWAISPIRAWAELGKTVGWEPEDILPWKLHETNAMSVHYKQMGYDVLDEDALRRTK